MSDNDLEVLIIKLEVHHRAWKVMSWLQLGCGLLLVCAAVTIAWSYIGDVWAVLDRLKDAKSISDVNHYEFAPPFSQFAVVVAMLIVGSINIGMALSHWSGNLTTRVLLGYLRQRKVELMKREA
jgi:hypothetical protein